MQLIKTRKRLIALALLAVVAVGVTACNTGNGSAENSESARQQKSYTNLVDASPAQVMTYPVTRKTINFWITTWDKPGQLAYVYLMNVDGDLIGYYVLQGPPVSMCTSLTPTYKIIQDENDSGQMSVPAPSVDGAYYSGGECNTYYGKEATTGAYVEFSVGQSMSFLLYNQPLPNHPNVPSLSPTATVTPTSSPSS